MLKLFNLLILLFSIQSICAAQELAIGEWQSHLPYKRSVSVTQSNESIIYSTPLSILSINKNDNSLTRLSKVDGLSDVGINKIVYDHFNDQLFILYSNSNIDIVTTNAVINISNILNNRSISGSKSVNDIYIENSTSSFLSTDFGIVEFNPADLVFGSTIRTGVPINQITSDGSILFAASSEGVYFLDRNQTSILADFDAWTFAGSSFSLPEIYNARSIVNHQNKIYIGADNSLYESSNSDLEWSEEHIEENLEINFIKSTSDRLIATWSDNNFNSKILFFQQNGNFVEAPNTCRGVPQDAVRDEMGNIWYADLFDNFRMSSDYTSPCQQITIDAPYSEKVSDIVVNTDMTLVASGGVAENFTYLFSREGFYLLSDNTWSNFNEFENSDLSNFDLLSVFRVAIHPNNSKIYAGSYWAGLLEYNLESSSYTLFNKTNSSLRGSVGDPARERITGLAFDQEENLWVATYNAPEPINVYTNEGQWRSFEVPSIRTLSDVVIDRNNYKWFTVHGGNGGVLIYDSGPSIQNSADDQFRFLNSSNSELTTNNVLSITVDLDGEVWVGTEEGVVIFDCGSQVFDAELCRGVRRKVLQDSIAAFLLADQQVNTIAVDGGDQKWFGTRNGLFVQSPLGDQQIAHFTTENSPLFDNEITALAYEPESGKMWIGTNRGLIALKTESTGGARFHKKEDVYAYPNPVHQDYKGPIAIRGLVTDARVQITDINGNLIAEINALGGQAIWNGRDSNNQEVPTGVYLVFSTDINAFFESPDSFVTKIMIVR